MGVEDGSGQRAQSLLRSFAATFRLARQRTYSKMGLVTSTPLRTTYFPLRAPYPARIMRPVFASRPTATVANTCFFVLMGINVVI
jgi:uncharacterized Zn finger protein